MRKFGYSNSIEYVRADDYFTPEERKLFLCIPHKISQHDKITQYSFDVPENGKYPVLSRVNLIEVKEAIPHQEQRLGDYPELLYNTSYWEQDIQTGFFLQSNHGSQVFDLLQELYKHDKVNGPKLLNEYYDSAVQCKDIAKIEDIFVRQVEEMQKYLKENNIVVEKYDIDYSVYSGKADDEMEKEVDALYKKYGDGYSFEAYNDSDYTPMILDGDYCIHDSSSAKLFTVKEQDGVKKVYGVDLDRVLITDDVREWLSDFFYDHKQKYIFLKNSVTEADLIAEIKDGRLTKASSELMTINSFQTYIVNCLTKEGKITSELPNLSFRELLNNHVKQLAYFYVEERSILPLLNELRMVNGVLTYEDFSSIKKEVKVIHEGISDHTLSQLTGLEKDGSNRSSREPLNLDHLAALPSIYKEQINEYLDELLIRDSGENCAKFVDIIKGSVNKPVKRPTI